MASSSSSSSASSSEAPPDVASASTWPLFRLRHLRLGLDLRPEARALAGCLVLDLCDAGDDPQDQRRSLVLDTHPALRVASVDFRASPAGRRPKRRCGFVFSSSSSDKAAMDLGSTEAFLFSRVIAMLFLSFFPLLTYFSFLLHQIWWLDPDLTYGNSKPFVFTQGHSVCNRSFFPCFDTPAVKCTYSAIVKAPAALGLHVPENDLGSLSFAFAPSRYDIVFLPPSFPIVAMENPCLTFIISSILESDEFLIIDVIHEVAHSWFGNAVTNATWEEMWLSEGLATYAQRRITTETYGAAFTCLETAFRLDALHRQMKLLGEDNPVSKLQVKLEPGVNPSNLMNLFTYEKGYCFVYYLSQLCGDPIRFDAFLRKPSYFGTEKESHAVPSLIHTAVSLAGLEFERWLNATGPPLIEPDLSQGSSLTSPVETLFNLWTTEPLDAVAASNSISITEWQTFQTVLFLDRLLDGSPLPHEVISKLSECYSAHLDSMNAEIRIRWLQIIVRNDYYPDLHKVRRFLENQMSRMYTIPLYEDLCTGTLKSFALEVFYQTQNQLHPNLRKTIQQILTQGLNPLLAMDTTAVAAEAPVTGYEDKSPEAVHSAISLRDVNVSA
ncbi:hypothetical protein JD844_007978 [Phrynosoma platyrhinos]|uniref:Peptidase M1 leukotriene A4 hydrolase/aminopeptidase C-terminal domain-containing protein n=1 Tax=Phrynosoma platyrhinos TaxID=52577 RepID=A0ABQ7T3V6_PHRPL|nr:hypothetical protein JD844_007978 [Phrynosoma platyrhinos]